MKCPTAAVRRQVEQIDHLALILVGKKAARHGNEHHGHHGEDRDIGEGAPDRTGEDPAQGALITLHIAVEGLVEPVEEPSQGAAESLAFAAFFAGLFFDRLQQGGAEGRCQHQGDGDAQHHGRDDGDRELPIDRPGRAAEEGHGQEHGREHRGDADQGARDLAHRLDRRLFGREALFLHDALHILHHHDGVIHQEADRQHHGEEGQHIDRIARHGEDGEGAQQHNGNGDGRDQGRAPILQEQEHHRDDQDHGRDQGDDHILDRELDEAAVIHREGRCDARRELGGKLRHLLLHQGDCVQRIGAGGQLDREAGRGVAVVEAAEGVAVARQLHPCDVREPHHRAVGRGAQNDLAELFRGLEAGLGVDRGVELLTLDRGQGPHFAGRHLDVLGQHRGRDIRRHQLVIIELIGVEPDPYRGQAAKLLGVAHPVQPRDRIDQLAAHIVAQIDRIVASVGVVESDDHYEIGLCLGHD